MKLEKCVDARAFRGVQQAVANTLGLSKAYVSQVVGGTRTSDRVLKEYNAEVRRRMRRAKVVHRNSAVRRPRVTAKTEKV